MNFAIYQSYVKEPLKFFAPGGCRKGRNCGANSPRGRKFSVQAPLQIYLPNEPVVPVQENYWQKERIEAKTPRLSEIQLKKIEITFEDCLGNGKKKKSEVGIGWGNVNRPFTTGVQEVRKNYRPVTVNPRYFRKLSV